ncbi:exopolysaccharide biosynthesis polyprenyl glycosylphosphotransferase, partial [Pseudothermotoga sp.]|uniref:exopolysaccharide biosynthesis polyprenyl glycosylphosphotransferase n=1 Tax=Pseudothermotoga sp. TaxID=2033661 RepID=UPI0031F6C464
LSSTVHLFLIDSALLWFLDRFLTSSVIVSTVFTLINCTAMFAFRVYEKEFLENLNEQIVRTFTALFSSDIFKCALYRCFEERVSLKYFALHLAFGTLTVSFINYSLCLFRKTKPKSFIVIGRKDGVGHILDEINLKTRGEYQFVHYVDHPQNDIEKFISSANFILVSDYELYQFVKDKVGLYNKKVVYLPEFVERTLKRIPIEVINRFESYYEQIFSQVKESPSKRVLDIACGVVGLVIFSPIMLILSILILLEDGRPVIFKQLRIGKDGKPFLMYKFRTMRNEESNQAKFADQENDRILKIGKFMRSFRLDECPQFLNILKGDMSIVGPRPEQIPFVKDFEQKIPYYSHRHVLKPGLTGWAQIMYKYSSTLEEVRTKLTYDLYYVKNRNIFMDLRIILQTVEAILWRRGAK